MDTKNLHDKLKKLPDHLRSEVDDYIDFLLNKYGSTETAKSEQKNKFQFNWEGGLSKIKDQYTSVALQEKAGDWR